MIQNKQVIAAGAFIFDKEERIFLAKFKTKFNAKWSIPGGKLEFGENAIDAVIREVKEETNIDIQNPEFLEQGSFIANNIHVIYIDYIADYDQNSNIKLNEEFSQWGFFTRKELDTLDIIPKTKDTILIALRKRTQKRWVLELTKYNLGLIRKSVSVHESQNNWIEAHKWVQEQIRKTLDSSYNIESIGSTSIPGLAAKPILDLLLIYSDSEKFSKDIKTIEELGFTYKGDAVARVEGTEPSKDRHFFAFYNPENNIDYVHLHALPVGDSKIDDYIKFRDLLRSNEELRKEYRNLKTLFREHNLVRHAYTRSKKDLIIKILNTGKP